MKQHLHVCKMVILDLLVLEFGPIGVFLMTYHLSDFAHAALWLAISTFATLVLSQIVNGRMPWFGFLSGGVTMVMAFISYWYNTPDVLIITDTCFYLLFAILLGASIIFDKHFLEKFFGHIFHINKRGWRILEMHWFFFFILAGIANELMRIYTTIDGWVIYKQFVVTAFLFFGLYLLITTTCHHSEEAGKLGIRKM